MKAYSAYKPTKIEWVGKIPSHWELKPIRAIFEERKESNTGPKTDFILSVMKDVGVIPYDEKGDVGNKKSDDIERYNIVHPGDLVLNKMNVIIGSVGISDFYGALSPVYIILYPREFKRNDHRFLGYLFKVKPFQRSLRKIANGILEIRESIKRNEFKKITLPLPYFEEQQRIADFLDQKTAEIDEAISKKQHLVELLEERKAILINQAVTKGLNPDVPMKDSRVEWIGVIPEHWNIAQNRRFLINIEQGYSPPLDNDNAHEEFSVLKLSAIKKGKYIDGEYKMVPKKFFNPQYRLYKGDLLLTRSNTPELVGDTCYVDTDFPIKVMISDLVYRLSYNRRNVDHEFMNYFYQSSVARTQIRFDARGSSSTMVKIRQDHIKSWLILVPPIDEQKSIIKFIKKVSSDIETVIGLVEFEVEKLQELRMILISQTVTGKIKI